MSLQHLADLLQRLNLEPGDEDILDVLWLAQHLPSSSAVAADFTEAAPEKREDSPDELSTAEPTAGLRDLSAEAAYDLYQREVSEAGAGGGLSAVGVRAPMVPAISAQLELSRALRPLTRKAPSRIHQYLDEERTARRVADEGLWVPAMKPAPTRWLDLALVVDGYESMSIWRPVVAELRGMLENLGAFGDIRLWTLDEVPYADLGAGVRRLHAGSVLRSPRELIDPAGRRVILVVSDCIGPIWQSQVAQKTLALWARRGPVAIVQPLPQRLWNFSQVVVTRARLHASRPGASNAQLAYRLTAAGSMTKAVTGSDPKRTLGIPIPVLQLDAAWLASWTRLVTGVGGSGVDAMVLFTGSSAPAAARATEEERKRLTAAQRIQRFRATASPGARRLAEFMSVAPVSVPVIQLVQEAIGAPPSQSQVAEVLLGGLLYRRANGNSEPDLVQYEFFPGVREILQRRLKRSEVVQTLRKVSDLVGLRFGQARDFRALLAGVDISGDFMVSSDSLPFAQVAAQALRSLGGIHAQSAERLAALIRDTDEAPSGQTLVQAAAPVADLGPPGTSLFDGVQAGAPDEQFVATLAGITINDRRSRQTPLMCPYCYRAFAERDILFRCAGRAGLNRTQCPRKVDPVAEREMGNTAPLPPVFPADGRKAQAVCPNCGGITRDHVCPECHSTLPANFGAVQGRLIALAGPLAAGKTAFMAVLIHELQHRAGAILNSFTTAADDMTQERFRHYCEDPIYIQSALPDHTTTVGQKHLAPFVYRFAMNQRSRLRAQSRELILSFADSAGEDLASIDKVEFMARYLAAADAVIVLIDPLQFRRVREQLRPGTPVPSTSTREQDPRVAFERITSLLSVSADGGPIQKPVAIVMSKIDALWQFLPSDNPLRRDRPPLPYFDAADNVAVEKEVGALLTNWGAADLDRMVRERYARAKYFALSALGVTPNTSNIIPAPGVQPYRITEPFTWLLSQFGLFRSGQAQP
jgi:Double-GTPase 2